jgi:membrane-associated phospholipid phosphatase
VVIATGCFWEWSCWLSGKWVGSVYHIRRRLGILWIIWDRIVLGHGGRTIIESLGAVVPSVLEIAYALVYALPLSTLAVLYLYGRREMADRFLTVVLLSALLCYAQFPFWPSDPPRVVFAGLDLPSYCTVFRRFNLWMLDNYGIQIDVFPSAHVAGALSTAFGFRLVMGESKRIYQRLFVIAFLIAIATVCGRGHYLADAICGAVIALHRAGCGASPAGKCQLFDTRLHSLRRAANQSYCVSNAFAVARSQRNWHV